jgi:hypothetical protein
VSVLRVLACSVDVAPCPAESQVWVSLAETVDWTALGVTAAEILYVFTWGAGSVLALWAIGYALGAAVTALGKL